MTDKKWLAGVFILMVLFGYLFYQFARESNQIDRIVTDLKEPQSPADKARHVVLIEQEQGHPYWQLVEQGASDAAKLYGIDMEFNGPIRDSMDEQIKLMEKAIASKVDGIIVQGLNDMQFTPVINKAIDKGIPVLTIDTDAPTSKRLTYVGTDNLEAGKMLGHLVADSTGGKGKIGVIIGSQQAESQLQRLSGLNSVVADYPELQVLDVRASNISMMEAIQKAADMLRDHPEITTMVGTSATDALGILQAKKSLKRTDIKIIGFDDLPETLDAIAKNEIEATVVQQPYLMGEESVRLLHAYFGGETLPFTYYTKMDVIDRHQSSSGRKRP